MLFLFPQKYSPQEGQLMSAPRYRSALHTIGGSSTYFNRDVISASLLSWIRKFLDFLFPPYFPLIIIFHLLSSPFYIFCLSLSPILCCCFNNFFFFYKNPSLYPSSIFLSPRFLLLSWLSNKILFPFG